MSCHSPFHKTEKLPLNFYNQGFPSEIFCRLDNVKSMVCAICLEVYRDPVTTNCIHTFCKPCFAVLKVNSQTSIACPCCREQVTMTFESTIKSSILSQQVICPVNYFPIKEPLRVKRHRSHLHCLISRKIRREEVIAGVPSSNTAVC